MRYKIPENVYVKPQIYEHNIVFLMHAHTHTRTRTGACVWNIRVGRKKTDHIVQELCESRGGRPGLSVLTAFWFPWT